MGNSIKKLKSLHLPAQSGKTRKVEEQIELFKSINDFDGTENDVNLWISANNRLLVYQTAQRLEKDLTTPSEDLEPGELSNAVIDGNIFSWTSGTKKTNISHDSLAFKIFKGEVEMVVLCSNSIRIKYLIDMIKELVSPMFKKKINIWIDEADRNMNMWSKYPDIIALDIIKQVTLVSATMDNIVKKYGTLKMIAYENTHPSCYRCLRDSNMIEEDVAKSSAAEYVSYVLKKYTAKLVRAGIRAFIPGNSTKKSHEEIATLLKNYGFVVIILNGERKELRFPEGHVLDLKDILNGSENDSEEFNKILARLYTNNVLNEYPFAITGFTCVERGITFQCAPQHPDHNGFLFDYGIIPPISKRSEAYQTMARLFGNVGDFPDYKPCDIYSNSATFKSVNNQEQKAIHIARIAFVENREDMDASDYTRAAKFEDEKNWTLITEEFKDRDEANQFLQSHGCPRNNRINANEDGFLMSSISEKRELLSYNDVTARTRNWSKKSGFDINADPNKKCHSRMIICYRDPTNIDSVVFIVRVLKRNEDV
jgi:hypothetical protein